MAAALFSYAQLMQEANLTIGHQQPLKKPDCYKRNTERSPCLFERGRLRWNGFMD